MLAHTIEAVAKDKITRTHCNTCGAQHAHRRNPPGTARSRTGRAADTARSKPAAKVDYGAMLQGRDATNARAYNMTEFFRPSEVIYHPVFGVGCVVAVRDANKMDVGFSDGVKTLRQGTTT